MQKKMVKNFTHVEITSDLIQTEVTFVEDTTYTWKS